MNGSNGSTGTVLAGALRLPTTGTRMTAAAPLVALERERRTGAPVVAPVVRLPALVGDRRALRAAAQDLVVTVLVDCSGSEYGPGGDPQGMRFACARSLVRLMRATGGGSMRVVVWGSAPRLVHAAPDVNRDRTALDSALSVVPPSMGGNDLAAALRLARQAGDGDPPTLRSIDLVVTDGLETLADPLRDAIAARPPGSVHLLLVPGAACPDDLAREWAAFGLGSFTRLPPEARAMAWAVGEVYGAAVGGTLPGDRGRARGRGGRPGVP